MLSQDEGNIVEDGLLEELVFRILKNQTHPATQFSPGKRRSAEIHPLNENAPVGGLQKTVQMLNQGGLPGPCLPDNRHAFPFEDLERDLLKSTLFQRSARLIDMGQVFNPDDGLRSGAPQSVTL
jgi:hypothetical protein